MNRKDFIYTLAASLVLGLGSCTSEDFWDTFDRTVDGSIEFNVGVEASPAQRAMTRTGDEETTTTTTTSSYYAMQAGTQVRLKVDGTWNRKDPSAISKQTTCTTVAATTEATKTNALSFTENETLYWDDYGIGDPDNSENNANGLQVLGVAVDGMDKAPEITEWESLEWPVITNGKNVLNSDILVSNNLTGTDAYKFVKPTKDHPGNLVFVHPLSKITINLKAGVGFTNGKIGNTTYKFVEDPVVTLTNATTLATFSDNAYCLTNGTVNIASAKATSDGTKAAVVAGTTSTTDNTYTVIKQAIVYPGTQFGDSDDDVIAVVQADGNVYYVKADQIRAAMKANDESTNYTTKAGYNYIINVTVTKTGILTTATVTAWNEVNAEEAFPKINVIAPVGNQGGSIPSDFNGKFGFWLSTDIDKKYVCGATPTIKSDGSVDWTETTTLYWPDHNTHYHLRGIYPKDTEVTSNAAGEDVVKVANGAYDASTSPSNLLIGMPEFDDETLCGNKETGHTQVDMRTGGICAREGYINLNFRYMMSQVEVKLTSQADDNNSTKLVDLKYVKVELVNVGTGGNILLSDRSAVVPDESDNKLYALHMVNGDNKHYHDIIIPQTLIDNDKNKVKFKITVYSEDPVLNPSAAKDVYYADVAPIKVAANGGTAKATNVWEAGVHYVYNLNITKTQINATATLTDWTTVAASEEVWF
ncbi:Fimbrillin-like [Prevotella sp. khp1]|uniref:fimbrillin family protein n=1 Tax=Prevotellaceae TaxID=171552 RepID=UPI0008915A2C|nr:MULTISPECIES: fimbrillin family protein [Prevotellaceae]QVJ80938.1 fimbrillin family protein [Xylanibacter ruminicola]SDQ10774.1 Fimbrillin-like [Prevotella sp. khp1]